MVELRTFGRLIDISEPILAEDCNFPLVSLPNLKILIQKKKWRLPESISDIVEPILTQDFPPITLSLKVILRQLDKEATKNDYFVALLLVFLAESGFRISLASDDIAYQSSWMDKVFSSENQDNNCLISLTNSDMSGCNQNTRLVRIPKNWKSITGRYEIYLTYKKSSNTRSKFIAEPMGDALRLSMYPSKRNQQVYTMTESACNYVYETYTNVCEPSKCSQYMYKYIKNISHSFKNRLVTPSRTDVLMELGFASPSFQGLPVELQIKIAGLLDVRELTRLAQCSHHFSKICSEPQLWQRLLQKYFSKDFPKLLFYMNGSKKIIGPSNTNNSPSQVTSRDSILHKISQFFIETSNSESHNRKREIKDIFISYYVHRIKISYGCAKEWKKLFDFMKKEFLNSESDYESDDHDVRLIYKDVYKKCTGGYFYVNRFSIPARQYKHRRESTNRVMQGCWGVKRY